MITSDRLKQFATINRLLAHEHYFHFFTVVYRVNGACIVDNGVTSNVQRRQNPPVRGRALAIRAGLNQYSGEDFEALRICAGHGLIGIETEKDESYPFLNKDYIVEALSEQVLLLGGGVIHPQGRFEPLGSSLGISYETLLVALKSVGALSVLFTLPTDFTSSSETVATILTRYGHTIARQQIDTHVNVFTNLIPPLANVQGQGKMRVYKHADGVDVLILLLKRLVSHFSRPE